MTTAFIEVGLRDTSLNDDFVSVNNTLGVYRPAASINFHHTTFLRTPPAMYLHT